jgi:dTDP-4-dehydrorhamnose reductase
VHQITGKPLAVTFQEVDLRDANALTAIFAATKFDGVIHFAAFKARAVLPAAAASECRAGSRAPDAHAGAA